MKKILVIFLALIISVLATGCEYVCFEHKTFTNVEDYETAFNLPEIRYDTARDELFPQDISELDVECFYFEYVLGIVGSADVEILLTVKYEADDFEKEVSRLSSLADGGVEYDEKHFSLPAYVVILGELNTSVYALVDDENLRIHYIHLQLLDKIYVDIPKDFMPRGYNGNGNVSGVSFDAYD